MTLYVKTNSLVWKYSYSIHEIWFCWWKSWTWKIVYVYI